MITFVCKQCFGFGLLAYGVFSMRSCRGISSKTLRLYGLVYVFRLFATCFFDGYRPVDKTGECIYQIADVCGAMLVVVLLFCIHGPLRSSYQEEEDSFQIRWVIGGSVFTALLIHPHLNDIWVADTAWTISVYLGVFVMVPQLWLITRSKATVELSLTGHFVATSFMAKLLCFCFWSVVYDNIFYYEPNDVIPGYMILIAHIAQVLIMGDFMYFYVKKLKDQFLALPLPV